MIIGIRHFAKHVMLLLLTACLFFMFGWFAYPLLLDIVTSGFQTSLAVTSAEQLVTHRLLTALAFVCTGATVLVCGLLYRRASPHKPAWPSITLSFTIAIVAIAVGLFFLKHRRISRVDLTKQGTSFEFSYPVDLISLHYVILIAGALALTCGIIFALISRTTQNN